MKHIIQTGSKAFGKEQSIHLPKTFGKAEDARSGSALSGVEARFAEKADKMVRERRGMA